MALADVPLPAEIAVDVEPFDDESLDRQLADPDDAVPGVQVAAWRVVDVGSAEWAMQKVAALTAEERMLTEQAEEFHRRIDNWRDRSVSRLVRRREFFEQRLVAFQRDRRAADPKHSKSLNLPSGDVTSTAHRARPKIAAETLVLEWLNCLPADDVERFVQVRESVRARELAAAVEIVDYPVAQRVTYRLSCGHELTLDLDRNVDPDAVMLPGCRDCPADPVDGAPLRPVVHVAVEIVTEPAVVYEGERIPGVIVEPEHVTYKVRPS